MDELGYLTMSGKELNRLEVLRRVLDRRLTQAQAAEPLGLGVRQIERLCHRLRIEGPRRRPCTSPKVTLREKRQIRTARARADAPQVRNERTPCPTSLLGAEPDISTLD